jgi:hypothetical protein
MIMALEVSKTWSHFGLHANKYHGTRVNLKAESTEYVLAASDPHT